MRVLVTGGTGFLGKRVALQLQALGHTVTAFGRRAGPAAELAAKGVRVQLGDLADQAAVSAAMAGQDAVVHSGALSSVWGRYADFYRANVLGTRHVVEAARQHQLSRLVHISSPSIYVGLTQQLDIAESTPLPARSINAYAATKRLAECEIERGDSAGLATVTLRPQAIFGPGDPAIVPRLVRANERSGIPLFGDGQHLIDVTYVDNVVDAAVLALNADASCNGQKYNITNGEPIAFRRFLTAVLEQMGLQARFRPVPLKLAKAAAFLLENSYRWLPFPGEPVLTRYSLEVLAHSRTLDISKARRELGYAPRVSVAEGTERYVAWWLQQRRKKGGP